MRTLTQVFKKKGAVRIAVGTMYRETTELIVRLNTELSLLADIADMQGKATHTKRNLIAQANAVFIH